MRKTEEAYIAGTSGMDSATVTRCAMGVALITVCSWISIPTVIPFTLQTFAVCLVSSLFGARTGVISVLAYMLLGSFGFPVFSGFRAGASALMGATGGYILGFAGTAFICGYMPSRFGRGMGVLLLSMALGVAVCYAFGTAWFVGVYMRSTGPVSLATALSWCVIPYIPADAGKIVLASLLSKRLYPTIRRKPR